MIENDFCDDLPGFLSCFPEKLACYSQDRFFQSGWKTINQLSDEGSFQVARLWDLGSILFKADCILAGNLQRGLAVIRENGFSIRSAHAVAMNRRMTLELWKHSLGRLSRERIDLLARLQSCSASLYLIVERPPQETHLPCAVDVTELKGQVKLSKRRHKSLRHVLGPPHSAFFNFVHTADEPADLVRELGVMFDEKERRSLLTEVAQADEVDPVSLYSDLRQHGQASDLNFDSVLDRLRTQISHSSELSSDVRHALLTSAGSAKLTDFKAWLDLRDNLEKYRIEIPQIDAIILEGEFVPLQKENKVQPFPSCEAIHWKDYRPGRPLSPDVRQPDETG